MKKSHALFKKIMTLDSGKSLLIGGILLINASMAIALTGAQQNAVRTAESYLKHTPFSKEGLIRQLTSQFEGYDKHDAVVAVSSLKVDWNEQAARAAKSYVRHSGFSCKGLIKQLTSQFEGYTEKQARYGAMQTSACR